VETKLPLGNARAKSGQTKGFKHWVGTKDGGISTEATVTVLVTCGQSKKAIVDAAETCGDIAEEIALRNINDMDRHIRDFMRVLDGEGEG